MQLSLRTPQDAESGKRSRRWTDGWRADLWALLGGGLVPLAFAPFGWYPLAPAALVLLFALWQSVPPGRAFRIGWWFGLAYFGVGVNWVHISIHEYGHASLVSAWAFALLLVAFLAFYPALLGYLANRLVPAPGAWRWLGVLPAGWLLQEWLRGWLFTGFPWLNLGYSQSDGPLLGLAPIVGVYGVGWALAFSAGALIYLWQARRRPLVWSVGLILLLSAWGFSAALDTHTWTRPAGRSVPVALLQGNIPQELKWAPEQRVATVDLYTRLTKEQADSRIVVWPETAIPAFYHQVEDSLLPELREAVQRWDLDLITGIPVLDRDRWEYFNAVMTLDEGQVFYYKRHLVPFGEYMPLRPLLESFLSAIDLAMEDFSSGDPDQPLLRAGGYAVGTSICFEVAFGAEIVRALPEAAYLVNVSNDAWFGDSLAPHQHLEMARLRARETERYMLRATNTGISAIIDHQGRIQARSPQFETAAVRGTMQPRQGATPYVRLGDGPLVGAALLVVLLAVWFDNPALRRRLSRKAG